MNVFVKLCMFQNRNDGSMLLTLADINDECILGDDIYSFYGEFYSINPTFRPVLPNTNIFCYSQKSGLRIIYDMYNIDHFKDCVQFVAWSSPTENTVPLYISNNKRTLSFEKNLDDTSRDNTVSPQIYVLTRENLTNENNVMFKGEVGRCIPLKNTEKGENIFECVSKNVLELNTRRHGQDVSILDFFMKDEYEISMSLVIQCISIFILTYLILFFVHRSSQKSEKRK